MIEFIPQAVRDNAALLSIVGLFCLYLIADALLRRVESATLCARCGRRLKDVVWFCATCNQDLCCDCAFDCLLKHGEVEAAPADNDD